MATDTTRTQNLEYFDTHRTCLSKPSSETKNPRGIEPRSHSPRPFKNIPLIVGDRLNPKFYIIKNIYNDPAGATTI